MSPVEKIRQVTDTTRVSLPIASFVALLCFMSGAVAAGYTAKDTIIGAERAERNAALVAERKTSDDRYVSKQEYWQVVLPRLIRMESKLDQALERRR